MDKYGYRTRFIGKLGEDKNAIETTWAAQSSAGAALEESSTGAASTWSSSKAT